MEKSRVIYNYRDRPPAAYKAWSVVLFSGATRPLPILRQTPQGEFRAWLRSEATAGSLRWKALRSRLCLVKRESLAHQNKFALR
jgi:hypothetical protein